MVTKQPDGAVVSRPHPATAPVRAPLEDAGLYKIMGQTVEAGTLEKFDFQAIPQDFLDLVVKFHLRTNAASTFENSETVINADRVDANYKWSQSQVINGAISYTNNLGTAQVRNLVQSAGAQAPAGSFAEGQFTIAAYARTDNRKVVHLDRFMMQLSELATGLLATRNGFLVRTGSLEAVNRLEIGPTSGGAFVAGSYVHVYGVMPGFG